MVYYDTLTIGKTASIGLETDEEAKAPLHIAGGNGDLTNSEGDLKIGDDNYRLKIGVTKSGENAGDVRICADGGTNRLMLGGGKNDTLTIVDGHVSIGNPSLSANLEVNGSVNATTFSGNGSAITDLDAAKLTIGAIDEARIPTTIARESRFDSDGHKHTGAAGDGPKISHSNLDNILAVSTSSPDTTANKHMSDVLAKSWQDHVTAKSGNPHHVTVTDVGALPIGGGTINGILQVNGNTIFQGKVGIGTTNPDNNNKLQVEGNLHMNGNSIFLRVNPADQFDVIKWNSSSDRVDIGGFNGVNLCRTRGGSSPVLTPALSVDGAGNVGIGTTNPDKNNKLQVEGNLHMNGNSIFLRRGPSDQFDVIKWNSSADRIDIGGYNGINLCYTNGANNPITLKPALSVDAKGNVGIGTTDPRQKLDIQGNIRIGGSHTYLDGYTVEGNGYPRVETHRVIVNGAEAMYFKRSWEGSHSSGNSISIPDQWSFYAKYKNFLIDHPLRPDTHDLIHSTLEGPEVAVFYRGESQLSNGEVTVILPDYFEALTRKENRTVLLTPKLEENIEASMLGASDVKNGKFTVKMIGGKNHSQRFYWEVKAVRADVEILQVEQAKVQVE